MTIQPQSLMLKSQDKAVLSAIALWAASTTRSESWDKDTRFQDKISVVTRFFSFIGKHPSEIIPVDVESWRIHLEQQGKKPNTVYSWLSRLSSFYKWLMTNPQLTAQVSFNPVIQARPRSPRPYQSESVKAWSDKETMAILQVVKDLADNGSICAVVIWSSKKEHSLLDIAAKGVSIWREKWLLWMSIKH